MILDTTVADKKMRDMINSIVGTPYSFLEIFRIGTIGSRRMIIDENSGDFEEILSFNNNLNYCNIELRRNGIIVHISKRNSRYSWIIPYHKLVLFNSNTFNIHAEGKFLKMPFNRNLKANRPFIRKILKYKLIARDRNISGRALV